MKRWLRKQQVICKRGRLLQQDILLLGGLAAAMRRCCLIITNDSGPMHVAISQKVPIVAMYGPSNPKLYGPYTKDAVIVTAQPPCQGCADGMKHSCDDLQCMSRMTVEQVVAAAEKMLEK